MAEVKPIIWYEQEEEHGVLKDGDTLPVDAIPASASGVSRLVGEREEVTVEGKKVYVGTLEGYRGLTKIDAGYTMTTVLRNMTLQNNRTLNLTARRWLGDALQDEDMVSVNLPFPSVTRRTVTGGIVLQIERCPVTSVQTVRLRAVVPSTLAPTEISWASHPFADTGLTVSNTTYTSVSNITTTGCTLAVGKSGAFMAVIQGSY